MSMQEQIEKIHESLDHMRLEMDALRFIIDTQRKQMQEELEEAINAWRFINGNDQK